MAAFTKSQGKEKDVPTNVISVYMHVVEDVIENVRADFQSDGVDDAVLIELQALWELKMRQSGALMGGAVHEPEPASTTPAAQKPGAPQPSPNVHDLNVPYEATDDYEAPEDNMPYPPVPTVNSTGQPVMFQYMPPGPSESSSLPDSGLSDVNHGTPASYMQQPAPWMKPRVVEINVNESNFGFSQHLLLLEQDFFTLSTGKRKHDDMASGYVSGKSIPQQDGAGDEEWSLASSLVATSSHMASTQKHYVPHDLYIFLTSSSRIPQLDGIEDNYDDVIFKPWLGPQLLANDGTPKPPAKADRTDSDGSEPPLNEDDDDDLDDTDQTDEELKTNHLVLAQFDKVTRSKNKWKCTLKDGIMHLNNRDILFVKATGEFEF
ncbi:unnamed protein product [Sphagnum jensenii]|uniref:Uncharacterized protein n=1 Tax=Sphagnum jensenii TaxID=128206 RepID=A0ABP0X7L8_9BRYO